MSRSRQTNTHLLRRVNDSDNMNVQNLPKTIYKIENYGHVDSGVTYFSFIEPDNDTNPDCLDVEEMDAAETISNEAHYFSAHGKHIDHGQLLELLAEIYRV